MRQACRLVVAHVTKGYFAPIFQVKGQFVSSDTIQRRLDKDFLIYRFNNPGNYIGVIDQVGV